MFQTITHTGGHIQLSTFGNTTTIKAWTHGDMLGTYKTIAAAKAAITRNHKQWLREGIQDHSKAIEAIWN